MLGKAIAYGRSGVLSLRGQGGEAVLVANLSLLAGMGGIALPAGGLPMGLGEQERRGAALAEFDAALRSFVDELASAPAGSLGYLKPGDDYALGGLVFHVNAVLEHYLGAIDALVASGFQDTTVVDRPGLFETAND